MLDQKAAFEILDHCGISFYAGVPDSYLNGFCNYAMSHYPERTVIAANEGNAVAIAAGHYMACGQLPLVYMQNSGLGNAVNPLASLTDEHVYGIPMLLLIGWRGEPGTGDWPQHELQGEITPALLEIMHIRHIVLRDDLDWFREQIRQAADYCRKTRRPFGMIAPKGIMADPVKANNSDDLYPMSREEAIETVIDRLPRDTVYAATTGRATRELFYLRKRRGESMANDFLNVGSMGHASSVALGIAMERPKRRVVVLDGDSACIMHMGALTMASKIKAPNLLHIVLNNGAHESVGGQSSAGHLIDFTKIAEGCGYRTIGKPVTTREDLIEALKLPMDGERATFLDVRIHKGLSSKLPPLDFNHRAAIDALMDTLRR